MTKKRKLASLIGRLMVLPVIFISMTFPAPQPAYAAAEDYDLYIGSTQVTSDNANNIFGTNGADGQPTARYDAGTATLYLNGVNISADNSHHYDGNDCNCSLYSGTDAVKNLVITGENIFVSTDGGIIFELSLETEFRIIGTGTLTSTVTESGEGRLFFNAAAMRIDNESGDRNIGNVYMGNEDGTGPTLKLTAQDTGADFSLVSAFYMQGGTIIAQAKGTPGAGVTLPVDGTYFNGGTIAGYGTPYENNGGGAFEGYGDVQYSQLGMQRVYPEPEEGETNYEYRSGWCVVGMTQGDHVADTNAVLKELGLFGKTGSKHHTDTLTDSDADINVWGYTKDTTVYSVDVEWGAMTFEYEVSSWDPENHQTITGAGWKVYDSATGKVVGNSQHDINKVTVTNHSNAEVFATLSYTGNDGYTGITGGFTKKADDLLTAFTAAVDSVPAYLTLDTADNNKLADGQGQETVGNVYFMPSGIGTTDGTVNDITQWTKIGKITVGILTERPQ